jgi:orotidine-5'-phosphate decarboxylase
LPSLAATDWNRNGQLGLVVGATYPAEVARVRALAPELPLLIPGVGAQGGDAHATVQAGFRATAGEITGPIVVNCSAASYASGAGDFALAARAEARAHPAALACSQGLNGPRRRVFQGALFPVDAQQFHLKQQRGIGWD